MGFAFLLFCYIMEIYVKYLEGLRLGYEDNNLKISKKTFVSSVLILFTLIIFSGLLTLFVKTGEYDREIINGRESIIANSFQYTDKAPLPVWRWITAPIEVLFSDDATILIVIILFLLIIGGSFAVINNSRMIEFLIDKIIKRYSDKRYYLLGIITLTFMLLGSVIGIFEEIIPLIPIVIILSFTLGWDSLTGLGMSILAAGFGFAAGVANPFTVGVAQNIAELPMFSGIIFRVVVFILIYIILMFFLVKYAKRIEKKPELSIVYNEDQVRKGNLHSVDDREYEEGKLNKALKWFGCMIILIFIFIISSSFIDGLSDFSLPVVALLFLIGGVGSGFLAGDSFKKVFKNFLKGSLAIAPGVILILMASSVKHILESGEIMDTILNFSVTTIADTPPVISLLLIYLLVLVMNFFIASGSAKAFLIMPIITPLVDLVGINRQLAVLAYAFGDGFSNVLYPTNAVLLISLGLTVVSYQKWFKWIFKLQLFILTFTSVLLVIAYLLNYGPF